MAKRKASGRPARASKRTRVAKATKSVKQPRQTAKKTAKLGRKPARKAASSKAKATKKASVKPVARSKAKSKPDKAAPTKAIARKKTAKKPAVSVVRPRTAATSGLGAEETLRTPPSSLNLNRRGSAARTGRAEIAETKAEHSTLTPSITGGDVDANVEDAYFTGDEAPGGDNPTPDQDVVDEIGKALGVEYQDNEELRGSDKVADRDKHRWELDPASAEDYRDRS